VKAILSDKDKENSIPNKTDQKPSPPPANNEPLKKTEEIPRSSQPNKENLETEKTEIQPPPEEKKEKLKKKKVNLESLKEENDVPQPPRPKKEVIIEEEKVMPHQNNLPLNSEVSGTTTNNPFGNDPNKINQAKKSAEQLKNMSPDQMNMMTNYFKQMDNNFLRQMMKQQSGVDMSDVELENVKNMMTPDMLKMMSGMNFDNMNMNNMNMNMDVPVNHNNQNESGSNVQTSMPAPAMNPNMNIGNLMQNTDMINGLMENMKKNPEMLKSMGKMLGENHPLSGLLNKSSPEDLQKMMNVMQVIVGFLGKIMKVIGWMRTNWKLVAFVSVMMILYYFYF